MVPFLNSSPHLESTREELAAITSMLRERPILILHSQALKLLTVSPTPLPIELAALDQERADWMPRRDGTILVIVLRL
jgi:hypothetical protein